MRLLILMFIASILFVSSCTIQKRSFRNGYYISWNKSLPKERDRETEESAETERQIHRDTLICREETGLSEALVRNEQTDTVLQVRECVPVKDTVLKKTEDQYSETALTERLKDVIQHIGTRKPVAEEEESTGKRANLFALNSFVFAVGYVVLIFLASEAGSGVNLAIAGAVICFFAAIAFAITGLLKWRRDHSGFWGTFFAVMALILLVSGSLACLIYFIADSSFG